MFPTQLLKFPSFRPVICYSQVYCIPLHRAFYSHQALEETQQDRRLPGFHANRILNAIVPDTTYDASTAINEWNRVVLIEKYRSERMRPMTLRRLVTAASSGNSEVLKFAEWVRVELCVRFAHRLYDFHRLPFFVLSNPSIKQTYAKYVHSFDLVSRTPPMKTEEAEKDFVSMLKKERDAHETTVDLMGQGAKELKALCPNFKLDGFLKRFFFFRMGRTVMIDHLASMRHPLEGWTGCINMKCRPYEIIQARATEASQICRRNYGVSPKVVIAGELATEFSFIPSHLSFICIEVLKNAMRATVEFHYATHFARSKDLGCFVDYSDIPNIEVKVNKGKSDVVIIVSDKGGGIRQDELERIWNFGYTSTQDHPNKLTDDTHGFVVGHELAGHGFGCPLSRVFARYFGGDLQVQSFFGIGTDVYIRLNHIGDMEEAMLHEEHEDLKRSHAEIAAPLIRKKVAAASERILI